MMIGPGQRKIKKKRKRKKNLKKKKKKKKLIRAGEGFAKILFDYFFIGILFGFY